MKMCLYCKLLRYYSIQELVSRGAKKSIESVWSLLTYNKRLIRTYHRINCHLYPDIVSEADPYKLVWVKPQNIEYVTGQINDTEPGSYHLEMNDRYRYQSEGFSPVKSGTWDWQKCKFQEFAEYQAIYDVFERGNEWEDTHLYQGHYDRIKHGNRSYGCYNERDLIRKFSAIEDLYYNILNNGYNSSRSLDQHPLDEVRVNIGRDGQFLFNSHGRHRLAIAKILDIDRIPVIVMVRHKGWHNVRRGIINNHDSQAFNTSQYYHPDLNDLLF